MIYLIIGFMACGKSTVGKKVASKLSYGYIDLDEEIEKKISLPITEIFSKYGENKFRKIENNVLKHTVNNAANDIIVSAGGGILTYEPNQKLLNKCTTIFLDIPWRIIKIRLSDPREKTKRPIALKKSNGELYNLWRHRRKQYLEFADYIIKVS